MELRGSRMTGNVKGLEIRKSISWDVGIYYRRLFVI